MALVPLRQHHHGPEGDVSAPALPAAGARMTEDRVHIRLSTEYLMMICSGSRLHFSQLLLTYCNTERIEIRFRGVRRYRDRHLEGIVEVHDVVRTLGLRSQSVLHTEHHAAWTQGQYYP